MQKSFLIKVYDSAGSTYLGTLNANLLLNQFSIKSRINQGFGEVTLNVNKKFDDTLTDGLIDYMNIYKIYEYDDVNHTTGILIYTGFLSAYKPYFSGSIEGIEITLLGLSSLLNFIYFKNGASYEVVYAAEEIKNIFEDIIDYFNTIYSGSLINYGSNIDTTSVNATYTFSEQKCLDSLEAAFKLIGGNWWFSIRPDGEVYLKEKPASAGHIFTIGKDIESAEIFKNSEGVINDVRVEYDGGNYDVNDIASIALYGKRSSIISESNIKNLATATKRGDQEILDYQGIKREIKLTVNSNYDLESIYCGETCKIINYNTNVNLFGSNMQIVAINYDGDKIQIDLEEVSGSYIDSLQKLL